MKNITADEVLALNADDLREVLNELMYSRFIEKPFDTLNGVQRTLFLCITLEDTCQADGILGLTDNEDVFFALPELCAVLKKLGAPKTARALQKFMKLLPEDTFSKRVMPEWAWFFESTAREKRIKKYDARISGYPDGAMKTIYHRYVAETPSAAKQLLAE